MSCRFKMQSGGANRGDAKSSTLAVPSPGSHTPVRELGALPPSPALEAAKGAAWSRRVWGSLDQNAKTGLGSHRRNRSERMRRARQTAPIGEADGKQPGHARGFISEQRKPQRSGRERVEDL